MAYLEINYQSQVLRRTVNYRVFLPNDLPEEMTSQNAHYKRPMKSLYLLHGYNGNSLDWIFGGKANDLANEYNLAVILPTGENGFYLDQKGTGFAYAKFVGDELVKYNQKLFGLSAKREDTFIGGFSMGGFGAIHTGLSYPETFGKVVALSSALIIHGIKDMPEGSDNGVADFDYYSRVFGDLHTVEESQSNPETLVLELKKQQKPCPDLFIACGTEDFLIEENRRFYQFLKKEEIKVTYVEDHGIHNWEFWNPHMDQGAKWLLEE